MFARTVLYYTDVKVVELLAMFVRHALHTSPVAPAVVEETAEQTSRLLDTSTRSPQTLRQKSFLCDLTTSHQARLVLIQNYRDQYLEQWWTVVVRSGENRPIRPINSRNHKKKSNQIPAQKDLFDKPLTKDKYVCFIVN